MNDLDAAIFSRLSTFTALTALVPVTHIAAVTIAQGILTPYVVYQTIDDLPDYSHQGRNGLRHPRVQVSSYASSFGSAKAINNQVVAALETWPSANADVQVVPVENMIPLYDAATTLFAVISDFFIWYTQS
jgi:hypothetical protein